MLTKLMLFGGVKIVLAGSLGMLLFAEMVGGLPGGWVLISLLLNVFLLGWHAHAAGSAYIGGLVPPDKDSSKAYRHFFDSSHLFFNRAPASREMLQLVRKVEEEM